MDDTRLLANREKAGLPSANETSFMSVVLDERIATANDGVHKCDEERNRGYNYSFALRTSLLSLQLVLLLRYL